MSRIAKALRIVAVVLSFLTIGVFSYFRVFDNYELSTLDFRFLLRGNQPQNDDIAIIEIADDSINKIGRWPFSRNWHASLINVLSFYGARMIVFDIIFSEPAPGDDLLVESTRKAANVYYAFSFDMPQSQTAGAGFSKARGFRTPILDSLEEVARGSGYINVLPDIDGKTRRVPPFIKYAGSFYKQLGFLAACDYLGEDKQSMKFLPSEEVRLVKNNIRIPLDENSNMLINFQGTWKDVFRHYSYVDILKAYSLEQKGQEGAVNLEDLRGKVCFVGLTATGLHDLNPVPMERRYPAIGIHINVFNTVVTDNFLRRLNRWANLAVLLFFSMLVGLVTFKLQPRWALSLVLVILIAFISMAFGFFAIRGIWIDFFYPLAALFAVYLGLTSYRYLLEIQKRQLMEKELEVARKIQISFLPSSPPPIKGTSLSADMTPARHVGGDLYDFVRFSDEKAGLMIGDVSGKGVPAALYMAKAMSEFRFFSRTESNPAEVISKLNSGLAEESKSNLFVTMAYLVYDSAAGGLSFANGGHNPPILLRKTESALSYLETEEGMPLGIMDGNYSLGKISLSKGDKLILYTDGVTEAKNSSGDDFGDKRLADLILSKKSLDSSSLLLEIKNGVKRFVKKAPQSDDITVIVMEVNE